MLFWLPLTRGSGTFVAPAGSANTNVQWGDVFSISVLAVLAGAAVSNTTGLVYFVGDSARNVVSITSSTGSASRYTIQASDAEGFQAPIDEGSWSNYTVFTNAGVYPLDAGIRWFRPLVDSDAASVNSMVTIIVARNF